MQRGRGLYDSLSLCISTMSCVDVCVGVREWGDGCPRPMSFVFVYRETCSSYT